MPGNCSLDPPLRGATNRTLAVGEVRSAATVRARFPVRFPRPGRCLRWEQERLAACQALYRPHSCHPQHETNHLQPPGCFAVLAQHPPQTGEAQSLFFDAGGKALFAGIVCFRVDKPNSGRQPQSGIKIGFKLGFHVCRSWNSQSTQRMVELIAIPITLPLGPVPC